MNLTNELVLNPPEGFIKEEVVTSWRTELKPNLKANMATQFQAPVRPNLVLTRRVVSEGASLADLMSKVCADLVRHIEGLSGIETTEFEFRDGTEGLLLQYTMPVHGKFKIHQIQAGRIDGRVFSTLTLSTESSRLTEDDMKSYLDAIASASIKEIDNG